MWAAILGVLASFPKLLDLVKAFSTWLSTQLNQIGVDQANAALKKAAEEAKKTKDTSKIDEIFDPLKGK